MTSAHFGIRPAPLAAVGWALLAFFALCFGIASALLPGYLVFSLLLVPVVAAVLLVRPEYGLTACIAFVCGLIHPALVPRIAVLGGSLAAADATLAMLAVYAVWEFLAHSGKLKAPPASVAGTRFLATAASLFAASLLFSIAVSLMLRDIPQAWALGETRSLLYVLVLPIAVVINLLKSTLSIICIISPLIIFGI